MRFRNVLIGFLLISFAVSSASAATIFSSGNDGTTLITIDTTTGVAATIGSSGFIETWPTAFTPDGTLWTIVDGFTNGQLATFNMGTGTATPVGTPMGTTDVIVLEADIGGTVYAAGFDGSFYTVNTTTGQLTLVGAMGINAVMDLAFDNSGTLYAIDSSQAFSELYTINPATGAATFICSLSGTPPAEMGLMVDPATNVMYATLYDDPSYLYQLNPVTCATVQIGTGLGVGFPHGGDISGATVPAIPVPTLSGLSLAFLVALLAILAAFVLRGYVPVKQR